MKTYLLIIFGIFAMVFTAYAQERPNPANQKQAQWGHFKAAEGNSWEVRWKETGVPRMVSNGLTKAYAGTPEAAARKFLSEYQDLFSMKRDLADLKHAKTQTYRGVHHVTFKQNYKNLRVEGGEYLVHIREDGRVAMANGHYYPNIDLSTNATLSPGQAVNIAKEDLKASALSDEKTKADLVIYPVNNEARLSYKTRVVTEHPFSDWMYIVDAHDGSILEKYSMVSNVLTVIGKGDVYPQHPGNSVLTNKDLYGLNGNGRLDGTYVKVYNDKGSEAYSSSHTFEYSPSNTHFDEVSLYYHTDNVRRHYFEALDEDNDLFGKLNAHAHSNYTCPGGSNNSCFSSGAIYFGDNFNLAKEDKVVHHEYSHAIINDINSGILSGNGEQASINEGLADFFAGSFTSRPKILEYAKPFYQRDMSNPYISTYSQYLNQSPDENEGGEFFSSILWDIRSAIGGSGPSITDFLVYDALYWVSGSPDFEEYREAMRTADIHAYSGSHKSIIEDAFGAKGVGLMSAPTVSISGPSSLNQFEVGSWSSNVSGGSGPYNYTWYKSYPNDPDSQPFVVSNGANYAGEDTETFQLDLEVSYTNSATGYAGKLVYVSGGGCIGCKMQNVVIEMPEEYSLTNNYPNPFNPSTQIKYALPQAAEVSIKVYNIMGQQVATLVNTNMSAGFHEVNFDAGSLSSGVYIARMEAVGESGERFSDELKMQLIK